MIDVFVDNLIKKSEELIQKNKGDYYDEEGLLVCGKCNGRKQSKHQFPIGDNYELVERIVSHLCDCEKANMDEKEEIRKQEEFEQTVKRNRDIGFPEKEMQNWTFKNDDMTNVRITEAMKKYVENFEHFRKRGKGLLLHGGCGTGKTYAACEIANALIDEGYRVLVTNFARIINTLQGTFERQEYIDSLNRFQLLVIDDLGIERDTAYAKEQVFNVIDSRYRLGLPMIITTNLTMDKIQKYDDIGNNRIYDRILERCHPIEVKGVSRRRKSLQNEYNDMKSLLGL